MFDVPPIPGQTPIDDISGLRLMHLRTVPELNAAEAENIRTATLKYLASRPSPRAARFDVAWMRMLHSEMFGDVWSWAGTFRRRETNVGSVPHLIEIELRALADDLRAWHGSQMPLLEQAVRLHHQAVVIHPFPNGNGRWSRMLSNIWLRLHGGRAVEWPEATIGTASAVRDEYLAAVRAADRGSFVPLISLHQRFIPGPPPAR